jgi:pyruvate,water dikinase
VKRRTPDGRGRAETDPNPPLNLPVNSWLKTALSRFARGSVRLNQTHSRRAAFRILYERFREILALNESTLELIADIEDVLGNPRGFSLGAISQRVRKSAMDVFVMVKNVNQLADNRHVGLYESLKRISDLLEMEIGPVADSASGRYVVSLSEIRATDSALVGSKMANLGEVGKECGLPVPDGFAITTGAFLHFMSHGELWEKCDKLETILEVEEAQAFADACREVQLAILSTPVPDDLAAAITQEFYSHFRDANVLVAMRSSAIGEDAVSSSHAGLYSTELDIGLSHLVDSYRAVLASAFSPAAVSYRFQRGITISDSLMAVGCVRMLRPRCSGILFSRLPDDVDADAILVGVVPGISAGLAAGEKTAETLVVTAGRIPGAQNSILTPPEIAALTDAARQLESHFGRPQDIEWAIDEHGIKILQSRPMTALEIKSGSQDSLVTDQAPLLEGGFVACPGIAAGPVSQIGAEEDMSHFPHGCVLVARHSTPAFAQIMDRCSAIVTDIGSPTGHMSSLAREFGVPAIVGLEGATRILKEGRRITVDAGACRVYDGQLLRQAPPPRTRPNLTSPSLDRVRRIARLVTPLTLTNPSSPDFHPGSCRSLHDLTRYVHEKAFEVMFHYGNMVSENRDHSARLQAKLPIRVEIFDVGGGLSPEVSRQSVVKPEQILSVPLKAFLEGLLEPRIRWDLPRPVSVRGFLSVIGESMAGLPPDVNEVGRISYAIISDRYMNFSTKAGYHFSTIDTYCGKSVNKNYIHFRFLGGAAKEERRRRRIRFLSQVVTALDFAVQVKGDTMVARLDKYNPKDIQSRLVSLGRLTLCARQMDMLMDNDSSPDIFARAFLAEEWHKF